MSCTAASVALQTFSNRCGWNERRYLVCNESEKRARGRGARRGRQEYKVSRSVPECSHNPEAAVGRVYEVAVIQNAERGQCAWAADDTVGKQGLLCKGEVHHAGLAARRTPSAIPLTGAARLVCDCCVIAM